MGVRLTAANESFSESPFPRAVRTYSRPITSITAQKREPGDDDGDGGEFERVRIRCARTSLTPPVSARRDHAAARHTPEHQREHYDDTSPPKWCAMLIRRAPSSPVVQPPRLIAATHRPCANDRVMRRLGRRARRRLKSLDDLDGTGRDAIDRPSRLHPLPSQVRYLIGIARAEILPQTSRSSGRPRPAEGVALDAPGRCIAMNKIDIQRHANGRTALQDVAAPRHSVAIGAPSARTARAPHPCQSSRSCREM